MGIYVLLMVLLFYSSALNAQDAVSTQATTSTPTTTLPADRAESQKELTPSGNPTYIKYIDPKTGEEKEKKVYYGFQYKKNKTDSGAKPLGDKQYKTGSSSDGKGQEGYRYGWQYSDAPQIKMSKTKLKATQFQKVKRSPIQVEGGPAPATDISRPDARSEEPATPAMTPEKVQARIKEMLEDRQKQKGAGAQ